MVWVEVTSANEYEVGHWFCPTVVPSKSGMLCLKLWMHEKVKIILL